MTIIFTWHLFNPIFFTVSSKYKISIKIISIRIDEVCCVKQYNNYFLKPNNFLKAISKKASLILEFLELINKLFTSVLLINYYFLFDGKQRIFSISLMSTKCIIHNPYCKGNKGAKKFLIKHIIIKHKYFINFWWSIYVIRLSNHTIRKIINCMQHFVDFFPQY